MERTMPALTVPHENFVREIECPECGYEDEIEYPPIVEATHRTLQCGGCGYMIPLDTQHDGDGWKGGVA